MKTPNQDPLAVNPASRGTLTPRQIAARKAWDTMRARKAAGGDPVATLAGKLRRELSEASRATLVRLLAPEPGVIELPAFLKRSSPRIVPVPRPAVRQQVDIPDYEPKGKLKRAGPTMVCLFADGVLRRMTFATQEGKPLNTGRGLRLCVSAYRLRLRSCCSLAVTRRAGVVIERVGVPQIVEAFVERDGAVIARVDTAKANAFTAEHRAGRKLKKTVWLPAVVPHTGWSHQNRA